MVTPVSAATTAVVVAATAEAQMVLVPVVVIIMLVSVALQPSGLLVRLAAEVPVVLVYIWEQARPAEMEVTVLIY
jgi:hypothetical protein